jgi:hypothetical protein
MQVTVSIIDNETHKKTAVQIMHKSLSNDCETVWHALSFLNFTLTDDIKWCTFRL